MSSIVYEARNLHNDKRYVGITSGTLAGRKRSHKHAAKEGGAHFHRGIRKHGWDAFDWGVRAVLPTHEEAQIAERILIALERPEYNMSAGGEGAIGCKPSAETIAKRVAARQGFKHTEESKLKISAVHLGKIVSEETREKIRVKAVARWQDRPHPCLGRKMSAETKAKISATKRARRAAKMTATQGISQ